MKLVFLDRSTLGPETLLRTPTFTHQMQLYDATYPEQIAGRVANADIVITNKVRLSADVIEQAPRLRMVAVAATGTDVVDLDACRSRGIAVSNIRNYASHTVPEHTFALIFALRRSITAYRDAVQKGRWQQSGQFCFFDHPIRDLAGSTLGVIGCGVLGTAVANMGRALGMRVLLSDHKGQKSKGDRYTSFEQTLAQSDVLTLHCPLNDRTRAMIGPAEFALMSRRPLLVNTARGGLIDEDAVGAALDIGQISGAAFDVVTTEPPPVMHPFMKLLDRPNFILTPHVAWASAEATQSLADQLIDVVEAFVRGKPMNVVGH